MGLAWFPGSPFLFCQIPGFQAPVSPSVRFLVLRLDQFPLQEFVLGNQMDLFLLLQDVSVYVPGILMLLIL